MTWRRPSLQQTRLSSRTHRVVNYLPNSRLLNPPHQHQKHQELEEEEAEYHELGDDGVAYLRVVVPQEDPEAEVASLGALLVEAVEHDDEKERHGANLIPSGAFRWTALQIVVTMYAM
jgi:hypothetical protein